MVTFSTGVEHATQEYEVVDLSPVKRFFSFYPSDNLLIPLTNGSIKQFGRFSKATTIKLNVE